MRKSHAKKAGAGGVSGSTGGRHLGADNAASFHATYSAQYLQRYSDLFQALAAPGQHVALLNAFATVHDVEDAGLTKRVGGQEAAGAGGPISCFRCPDATTPSPPPASCPYTQLKEWYNTDLATLLPPLLLNVAPHHVVLDMCAGPGAMSLVLAMQLLLGSGASGGEEKRGEGEDENGDSDDEAAGCVSDDGSEDQQGHLTPEMLQRLQLMDGVTHHTQPQPGCAPAAAGVADASTPAPPTPPQQPQQQQGCTGDGGGSNSSSSPPMQPPSKTPPPATASAPLEHQHTGGHAAATTESQQQLDSNEQDEQQQQEQQQQQDKEEEQAQDEEDDDSDSPPVPAKKSSRSPQGRLVCNESDAVRRGRLTSLVSSYIPGSLRRRVRVTGNDAAKHWARFEGGLYDRVLLRAPCSSERHVVQAAIEAGGVISSSSWSREQCANLAAHQLKLLLAGLRALKPGGRLVYCTSSIAAAQNDGVVQAALQQSGGAVVVVPVDAAAAGGASGVVQQYMKEAGAEPTPHGGVICLPDTAGWGPMFMAVLDKQS